jgi:hypothetical protein
MHISRLRYLFSLISVNFWVLFFSILEFPTGRDDLFIPFFFVPICLALVARAILIGYRLTDFLGGAPRSRFVLLPAGFVVLLVCMFTGLQLSGDSATFEFVMSPFVSPWFSSGVHFSMVDKFVVFRLLLPISVVDVTLLALPSRKKRETSSRTS